MSVAYLDKLKAGQRRAVEHGVGELDADPSVPLLVIAGAGTGKTNTLAHRVAHLIVNGADPRRILLMTFSRRAASEMTRRVELITRQVSGDRAGAITDALIWAGIFHGIGARFLRSYAGQIGLNPAFTIHDREDSSDLMNLVRHELSFSKTRAAFRQRAPASPSIRAVSTPSFRLKTYCRYSFPWCSSWAAELKQLFASYVEEKQRQNVLDYDDLLLYWAQMVSDPALADDIGGRFDHVLVDDQDTNRLQASILLALKPTGRGLPSCSLPLFRLDGLATWSG
jgi:DNA helicase II / ATP-dependent DNA helicase PcrA